MTRTLFFFSIVFATLISTAAQFDPANPKIQGVTVLTKTNPIAVGPLTTSGLKDSGGGTLTFTTSSVDKWVINSSGGLVPNINNTYDIGNGSVNPRDITVARNAIVGGNVTGSYFAVTNTTVPQFVIFYDASNSAPFSVSSGGDLTIAPTGLDVNVTGRLTTTAAVGSSGAGGFYIPGASGQNRIDYNGVYPVVRVLNAANGFESVGTADHVAFGNLAASAGSLFVTNTTVQGTFAYDASNKATLTISSGGDLTVVPSGGDMTVTGTLTVSSTLAISAGAITSGTYAPTVTAVANLDAQSAATFQYMRVGNVVTVSGQVTIDPTAPAASTQLGISLPIASNLATATQCSGTAFASGIAGQGAAILGDTTNDRAQMQWISGDVTSQAMYVTFTYLIQ